MIGIDSGVEYIHYVNAYNVLISFLVEDGAMLSY